MPALASYDYAIIRVVPQVERGEFLNVGVILFCRMRRYLAIRIELDTHRLTIFAPSLDIDNVQHALEQLERVCKGGENSGPVGQLSLSERFHWLVAPRSTIIQTSPAHSGLCSHPEQTLDHLMKTMVLL
jgi:hypothetical protein